jgi:hypothetical protein
MSQDEKSTVDRRRLLRRAGTVAAGVAGAGVAGAVAATPAQAAPGDPVLQGQVNNAGTATTAITSNGSVEPTLVAYNPYSEAVGSGTAAGPALRLVPNGDWLKDESPAGSLSADSLGVPWVSVQYPGFTFSHRALTDFNANFTVPITPTRAVDTRSAAGRARILNPSGNIDSAGRLIANRSINVDLSDLAFFPDAVLLNATVTGPGGGGFVTVWQFGTSRPGVSSINFASGQTLSNFVFATSGFNEAQSVFSAVSVFSSQTTHVILDLVAFVVSTGAVNPDITAAGQTAGLTAKAESTAAARQKAIRENKPSWE